MNEQAKRNQRTHDFHDAMIVRINAIAGVSILGCQVDDETSAWAACHLLARQMEEELNRFYYESDDNGHYLGLDNVEVPV